MKWLALSAVLFCFFIKLLDAKVVQGSIDSNKRGWVMLDKFCFDEDGGRVRVQFTDFTDNNDTLILFYSDQEQYWGEIENMEKATCAQKVAKAKYSGTIRSLSAQTSYRITQSRPRWWYIGVANCKSGMNFEYKITFLNTDSGFWKQFGWDEKGMYEMTVVFFLIQFLLSLTFVWILLSASWAKLQKKVPITFLMSSFAEMFGLFFLMIHYSIYSWDGVGASELQYTYVYLDMFSQMTFMAAIFFLVKGWPANLRVLTFSQMAGLLLFIFNILAYVFLFTWYTAGWDHMSTLYMYDSIAGYIIIASRAATLAWCEYELYRSYKYEEDDSRKRFYVIFSVFVAFWFIYLPFNVIISHFMAAWVRQKVIFAIIFTLTTITFIIPAALFWPVKRNPYFSMIDVSGKGEAYNSKNNTSSNVVPPLSNA